MAEKAMFQYIQCRPSLLKKADLFGKGRTASGNKTVRGHGKKYNRYSQNSEKIGKKLEM